jgi:hypothetical protein
VYQLVNKTLIGTVTFSNSEKFFALQKRIIRIMAGAQPSLFQQLEFPSVPCQYTLSLRYFIICNKVNFQTNSSIHNTNTRNKHNLRRPNVNLSFFQKSTFYAVIKIFKTLPLSLTILKNEKAKFEVALRKIWKTHSLYSVDEFFMCNDYL